MDFEWDEVKSLRNAAARRLSFDLAMALFDGPTLRSADLRRDYGEIRMRVVGRVRDEVLVCIYTDRTVGGLTRRRIISLRRANRRERHAYRTAYPE